MNTRMHRLVQCLVLCVLAAPGAFAAVPLTTPQLPDVITDHGMIFKTPLYRSFKGPAFVDRCRICSRDAVQGALNDCALLSSFAAVARVSPGTIQRALIDSGQQDTHGDEIYQVSYWDNGRKSWQAARITSAFPVQNVSELDHWSSNLMHLQAPWAPLFLYAQLPDSGATWPLLLEKGYAAMPWAARGYATPDLMEYADLKTGALGAGLDPAVVLTQLTGYPTSQHDVKPAQPGKLVASASILSSPSVANVGGHSVILGLLRGHIKAIEPNLKTCVTPVGSSRARPVCTAACLESHTCHQAFSRRLVLGQGQKYHVRVLDVDTLSGEEHEVYAFDESLALCTVKSPCKYDVPSNRYVLAGPLEISFGFADTDPLEELDDLLSRLQEQTAAVIVGSLTKAQCPVNDSICAQLFDPPQSLVQGHAYFLKGYERGTTLRDNRVIIGDPHGGALAERRLTLNEFYHSFLKIYENATAHEKPSNCVCED
jgi:hypothetical protein